MGSSKHSEGNRGGRSGAGAALATGGDMPAPILARLGRIGDLADGVAGGSSTEAGRKRQGGPRSVAHLLLVVCLSFLVAAAAAWGYARWRHGGIRPGQIISAFAGLQWGWVAASSSLALMTYLVRSLRWRVMMTPVKREASLWNLFVATAIGFTAVLLLGRAGEVVRPYLVARKEGVALASQLGVWTVERVYDLLAALALFGYALARLPDGSRMGAHALGYATVAVASACLIFLTVFGFLGSWAERRVLSAVDALPAGVRRVTEGHMRGFLLAMEGLRSRRVQGGVLAYTVLEWAVVTAGCWCLFQGSDWTSRLGWPEALAFVAWVAVGGIVQLPGIGGGAQLGATVALSELYGVPVEAALSLAIVLWVVSFVVIAPIGVALGLREGINWLTITMRKPSPQVAA